MTHINLGSKGARQGRANEGKKGAALFYFSLSSRTLKSFLSTSKSLQGRTHIFYCVAFFSHSVDYTTLYIVFDHADVTRPYHMVCHINL